ncbi:hypothetical protein BJY04DRAFT_216336 [Aspergillus karnatakaensis]|uniref:uncharacterized protein n=1 Tax=Aspergillus karnatakaensis TaxID=1810916 RepID=UPI003CCDC356
MPSQQPNIYINKATIIQVNNGPAADGQRNGTVHVISNSRGTTVRRVSNSTTGNRRLEAIPEGQAAPSGGNRTAQWAGEQAALTEANLRASTVGSRSQHTASRRAPTEATMDALTEAYRAAQISPAEARARRSEVSAARAPSQAGGYAQSTASRQTARTSGTTRTSSTSSTVRTRAIDEGDNEDDTFRASYEPYDFGAPEPRADMMRGPRVTEMSDTASVRSSAPLRPSDSISRVVPASRAGGSQYAPSQVGGSQYAPSQAGGSQYPASQAGGSQYPASQAGSRYTGSQYGGSRR